MLFSEKKQKNATARCFSRRSVSFFPVKSGDVPVQLELKAEAALDAVLDFDVRPEVLLRVNVEGAVLREADIGADARAVPRTREVRAVMHRDILVKRFVPVAQEFMQDGTLGVNPHRVFRARPEFLGHQKSETANEAVHVVLVDFRAVIRSVVVSPEVAVFDLRLRFHRPGPAKVEFVAVFGAGAEAPVFKIAAVSEVRG